MLQLLLIYIESFAAIYAYLLSKSTNLRLVLDWFRLTADRFWSPYKNITDELSNSYNLLDPDMTLM